MEYPPRGIRDGWVVCAYDAPARGMMYMGACSVTYKFTGKERDLETGPHSHGFVNFILRRGNGLRAGRGS